MNNRKDTKKVFVKDILIGGKSEIVIQTMTTTKTKNIKETVTQINTLATAGAGIVRLAVLDIEDANAIKSIKEQHLSVERKI